MRKARAIVALSMLLTLMGAGSALASEATEITNSGDDLRTAGIRTGPSLTPQLVSGGTFGQLWSTPVEGQVYAQPLLANGDGAGRDREQQGLRPRSRRPARQTGRNRSTWARPGKPRDIGCGDLAPNDRRDRDAGRRPEHEHGVHDAQGLRARAARSGRAGTWTRSTSRTAPSSPASRCSCSGTAQNAAASRRSTPTTELQRPGLLLMNGVVYAGFGSDCDFTPGRAGCSASRPPAPIKARWVADAERRTAPASGSPAPGLTSDGPGNDPAQHRQRRRAHRRRRPATTRRATSASRSCACTCRPTATLKATDFFAPFDAASLDELGRRLRLRRRHRPARRILRHADDPAPRRRRRQGRLRLPAQPRRPRRDRPGAVGLATRSCSASAPTAGSGRGRACGPATAAGSTSRPPPAATAPAAPRATCASTSTALSGSGTPDALAAGDLLRRIRLRLRARR